MTIADKIRAHYKMRSNTDDDHMHIGGKKATAYMIEKMAFKAGERILDLGCGIGGPARFIVENYDVSVTGIDLSPDAIHTARERSAGLPLHFDIGDGQGLPYDDASFDAALTLHVGMNVPDKAGLYRELARVLKPGGRIGVYDIMQEADKEGFLFPMPWAQDKQTSFLESPEKVRQYLAQAGFEILEEENRQGFALESLGGLLQNSSASLSPARRTLLKNLLENLQSGLCAPYIFIAERLK